MKSSYLVTLLCLWCSGCATYQYATVSSSLKDENSVFIVENDTTKIIYDFSGERGPVKIAIYNKLSAPLYVDWSRSALIIGDLRTTYYNKNATINADVTTSSESRGSVLPRTSSLEGTIITDQAISFIPPKSWAKEHQLNLSHKPFNLPAADPKQNEMQHGMIISSFKYDRENTPLNFRSFLTMSTRLDFSSITYFDHSFWISEISQTMITPRNFSPNVDQFYVKKGLVNP